MMRKQRRHTILKKKIRSISGETIAETLVTMIVLSLAVLILTGAVVSAAKVNKKADNTQTAFTVAGEPGENQNIIITEASGATAESESVANSEIALGSNKKVSVTVKMYKTNNKYYYYESLK